MIVPFKSTKLYKERHTLAFLFHSGKILQPARKFYEMNDGKLSSWPADSFIHHTIHRQVSEPTVNYDHNERREPTVNLL
jgi:hypothetical protein